MRALAILSVVAYHVGLPWVTGGFTGVDVFFVISGFLITQLLLKEVQSTGTISIADFYARRVRRLLPALATVIAVTLLAGAIFLPNFGEKQALAKSACAAVFFVANQYFIASAGGYFDGPAALLPLLHLWSLAVEEQFYLIWPLMILLLVRVSPPGTRTARMRVFITTLISGSFVMSWWLLRTHPATAFFGLPSRAWELGMGALLATIPYGWTQVARPALAGTAGASGVALIMVGFFGLNIGTPFPGPMAAFPVTGAALLILAGIAEPRNIVTRILAAKPLVTIGMLSYSWYLWHWPLLSIVRNRRLAPSNLPMDCTIALISLACAAVTVRFIENPVRHRKGVPIARGTVLRWGLATLAGLLAMGGTLGAWAKYGPRPPYLSMGEREMPPLIDDCLMGKDPWDGKIFRSECDDVPAGLAAGNGPLAVVWGDSHANAWAAGVRLLGEADRIEIREASFRSCPPLVGVRPDCRAFNAGAIAALQRLRNENPHRAMGVMLVGRWPGYLGTFPIPVRDRAPGYPKFYTDQKSGVAENIEAMKSGLRQTVSALRRLNIRVLILLSGPEFSTAPVRCLDFGYGESACDQPLQSVEDYRKPATDAIRQVAAEFSGVRVIDPLPFFCSQGTCPAFRNGHPVDYDDSHVSLFAAKAFAPFMREDFRWLFGASSTADPPAAGIP